mmetsp:Transcript_58203/g.189712  ORF Transcript_58203/g.189712 Transcript_58203/m.189712 type:complete len:332 (+) Transcript_58203:227-1222(+)
MVTAAGVPSLLRVTVQPDMEISIVVGVKAATSWLLTVSVDWLIDLKVVALKSFLMVCSDPGPEIVTESELQEPPLLPICRTTEKALLWEIGWQQRLLSVVDGEQVCEEHVLEPATALLYQYPAVQADWLHVACCEVKQTCAPLMGQAVPVAPGSLPHTHWFSMQLPSYQCDPSRASQVEIWLSVFSLMEFATIWLILDCKVLMSAASEQIDWIGPFIELTDILSDPSQATAFIWIRYVTKYCVQMSRRNKGSAANCQTPMHSGILRSITFQLLFWAGVRLSSHEDIGRFPMPPFHSSVTCKLVCESPSVCATCCASPAALLDDEPEDLLWL